MKNKYKLCDEFIVMKNNLLVVITMILHFFNQLISIPRNQTSQKLQKICFLTFCKIFVKFWS